MRVVSANRPETPADEDQAMLKAYREALTEIADILELPGSPSLTKDVVEGVRRLKSRSGSR